MTGSFFERYGGRPFLVAVAAMNAITGITAAAILAPLSFGADVDFLRRGAQGFLDGTVVPDFVFTPLCAVLAVPLALLSPVSAAIVMLVVDLLIVLAGVTVETVGRRHLDRILVGVAAITFVPVVNEVILGQVTLLIAASIYPARDRDGYARGVGLGIALALIPKPLMLPVLLWMLIRRPRALSTALLVCVALTAFGMLTLGIGAYADWMAALLHAGSIHRNANMSLWADGVTVAAVLGSLLVVLALAWTLRDAGRGFIAAVVAGLLLAPYTLLYAVSIMLLTVRPGLDVIPRATRLLALVANPAVLAVFPAWAVAILASTLPLPRRATRITSDPPPA